MDDIRDQFESARLAMRNAFVELSDLALRSGVDMEAVHETQHAFFDGNVALKKAFRVLVLLAEIRRVN